MSNLNSWEDDPAAQEENLAQRTQQMNIGNNQYPQGSFRPAAASFQPAAQTFQPGQVYGGNNQHAQGGFQPSAASFQPTAHNFRPAQAYGGNFVPQNNYGYPQYGGGQPAVYGQGGNQHGQYQGYQQSQGQQFQPQGQQFQPQLQRHPQHQQQFPAAAAAAPPVSVVSPPGPSNAPSDSTTKPVSLPKAKVLSIGISAPPKEENKGEKKQEVSAKVEAAAQVLAAKAVKKSDAKEGGSGKTSPTPSSGRSSPSRGGKDGARDPDVVQKEQTADVDDETLQELYGKEHVNILFMGHVDAGKSTLGGAILYATGQVDERTLDKYKREAKEMGRETWYLSWALDLTKEERSKGKTVEVGRAHFETDKRRYTILDAPGHKNYVPNMIGGASQADVGVLLISARKGEYETGFERGGQTREHAVLAKTQGVNKLVVVINKMDDATVQWSQERYKECTTKLGQFLKGTGYNLKTDVFFMPVAAQLTIGIKDRVPKEICPWWEGPSLLEYLDSMQALERKLTAPFMMPVSGKYRDLGTVVEGKIEAGVVKKSMKLVLMPNKQPVEVAAIYTETEDEVAIAQCGAQVRIRLRGAEEEDVPTGFVLCSPKRLVHCVKAFEAHIRIIELSSILTAGFNCVLHVHAAIEEVTFSQLLHTLQKGTNRKSKRAPTHAKKGDTIIARLEVIGGAGSVCVETYEDYPQMGRFNLRDQGTTIAVGKITRLITDDTDA
ncbi:P-loop containing nucleoside triphosphate hydrolase protein [Phialemonium atrogriseum]|uniref:Elongation factor 1-alpha n=1 Tax=Phialemonium atrogriseum TaxID=1093897 RepID=A0AAJ0FDG1_9PEZI|nr:P-loop containing nucleoside triphosphate hydrolase protein [Phialemonium atrogriseum]KAK1764561.1 P-loop containing nucleoside triphosphate hydrolase protein [Phialemonium atrogriseum]